MMFRWDTSQGKKLLDVPGLGRFYIKRDAANKLRAFLNTHATIYIGTEEEIQRQCENAAREFYLVQARELETSRKWIVQFRDNPNDPIFKIEVEARDLGEAFTKAWPDIHESGGWIWSIEQMK